MPETDYNSATPSAPWFTVGPGGQGQGQSITSQRTALNEQVNGVAADLTDQNTALLVALAALLAAL